MRVAYDARSLYEGGTGDRTYFANLIENVADLAPADSFTLYFHSPDAQRSQLAASRPNLRGIAVPARHGVLWQPLHLPPRLRHDGIDLLHSQYTLPPLPPCRTVVTIHDITFRLFPQWFARRACRIMNLLIPLAARRANAIITISQCSRNDIVREFGVNPKKVHVIPLAAANTFAPVPLEAARAAIAQRYPALGADYILGVGLRGPRKNVGVVLRAALELQRQGSWPAGMRIALTGIADQFQGEETARLGDALCFLGYVPEDDLAPLYSAARLCVYPSLYEGFGLPALEALACGCPLLASKTSSLPEVVGDAGWLLDPNDTPAWKQALEQLFTDTTLRATLQRKGLERAAAFRGKKRQGKRCRFIEGLSGNTPLSFRGNPRNLLLSASG